MCGIVGYIGNRMNRPEHATISLDGKDLLMRGQLPDGVDTLEMKGMRFASRVRIVLPKGGDLATTDSCLSVRSASEAIILVSLGTDYFDKDGAGQSLEKYLSQAESKDFSTLRREHTLAYRSLFDRVSLDLGRGERDHLPINERLAAFAQDKNDPGLAALYFQFGRYLLISSTRQGLLPPNLQGLWCNTIHTPWNGDYHLNINLQMNHWPAEVTNLSELHLPLIEWTKLQVPSGERTAKAFYNARGWASEWIWGTFNDAQETLYYGAFLVVFARNGYYATNQHYHVCVARDFIDEISDSDIRKGLFLHKGTFLPEGKTVEEVLDTQTSSMVGMFADGADGDEAYANAEEYIKTNFSDMTETPYNAYTSLKYACEGMPGIGSIPLIRSSEMLLIEAEANYFLNSGNPQPARDNLIELNKTSGRDPEYSCDLTGEQLFEEIAKYRRLELWGEGHSWLDCKRWGIAVVRKSFAEGGNYDASVSGTFGYKDGVCDKTFWKWSIPTGETDLNEGL